METVSIPNLDIYNGEESDLCALLIKILKPHNPLPEIMNNEKMMFFIVKLNKHNALSSSFTISCMQEL